MLGYVPGPTGQKLLDSHRFAKLICGPVGGGKSTVALMDQVQRSILQEPFDRVRRTKHLILRNTMLQLKSTVKPIIDTWLVALPKNTMGAWKLTDSIFEMKFRLPDDTIIDSQFLLMAADTPDDVRRLLSLEVSDAWIEEGREVDETIVSGIEGRVNRYPAKVLGGTTYPGVIVSTNPPPIGGFWHERMENPPRNWEIFMQPPALLDDGHLNPEAENLENLADDYYDNLIAGKSDGKPKSEEWVNVYLKNQYGQGDSGRPLYKSTFIPSFHKAKGPLSPIMQSLQPIVVGMDNGLTAAASFMQQDSRARVNVLGEAFVPDGVTMGVEKFLDTILIPYITVKWPGIRRDSYIFVLDPACFQRSQVDEKTIAQAVQARGFKVQRASTNDPERRISAVEGLLQRQIDGHAGFLFDPACYHTINALTWGHRWKQEVRGLPSTTVEKNFWSHIGDGVQYAALHFNGQPAFGGMYTGRAPLRKIIQRPYAYT